MRRMLLATALRRASVGWAVRTGWKRMRARRRRASSSPTSAARWVSAAATESDGRCWVSGTSPLAGPQRAHPVQLLGEVGQVEVAREGAGDLLGPLGGEGRHELLGGGELLAVGLLEGRDGQRREAARRPRTGPGGRTRAAPHRASRRAGARPGASPRGSRAGRPHGSSRRPARCRRVRTWGQPRSYSPGYPRPPRTGPPGRRVDPGAGDVVSPAPRCRHPRGTGDSPAHEAAPAEVAPGFGEGVEVVGPSEV